MPPGNQFTVHQYRWALRSPYLLTCRNRTSFENLLVKINSLRKLLKIKRSLLENQHKEQMVKAYADTRCTNFTENKVAFIASSLSKTRKCIVLDRVMSSDSTDQTLLITDPTKIKQVTNLHYQTIADSLPTRRTTLQDMTSSWQNIYIPEESIDISIYDSLLISPTDEKWYSTISALPNDKATGPSGISYEMIKNLSLSLSEYLKDIVTLCFNSGHIPSQ